MHFTQDWGYFLERTFKHSYALPLVHRPKGALLVYIGLKFGGRVTNT